VLINDNNGSKSNKVVVVKINASEAEQIDSQAIETYKRNASPDARLIIVPEAYAFSPTDKEVLLKMELIYVGVPFEERASADRVRKSFKPWWYVVDSRTGNVTHEYRTNRLPKHWWIY